MAWCSVKEMEHEDNFTFTQSAVKYAYFKTLPRLRNVRGFIQKFPDWVITKYTLTTINTRWEVTQRVMEAKLTRLTHKIFIQLHLVAESSNIYSSRSRRPVRKLLDTSYVSVRASGTWRPLCATLPTHSVCHVMSLYVKIPGISPVLKHTFETSSMYYPVPEFWHCARVYGGGGVRSK
jgi:ABC-type proline/glycine betaine transport system permease subunit